MTVSVVKSFSANYELELGNYGSRKLGNKHRDINQDILDSAASVMTIPLLIPLANPLALIKA